MSELTEEDDEFKMLREVTREYPKQKSGSSMQKSGKATLIVIRKYLVKRGFEIAELDAKIPEKGKMNLLFLLKTSTKPEYSLKDDIYAVLKITNNAVGKTTSERIRNKFDKLRRLDQKLRFATVVLSERISYNYPINIGEVFTLIARKKSAHKLYLEETIMKMLRDKELSKTGEWEKLINYLKKPINTP